MIVFTTSVLFLIIKATSSLDVYETLKKEIDAEPICVPNMVYKSGDVICKCDQNGYWPDVECSWIFRIANSTGKYCQPNSYVMIKDCIICRCNDKGRIDKNICTDNCPVSRQGKRRSGQKLDSVYGSCVPKNWYSLAPCQFCYCVAVNNLVCNTGNRKYNTQLDLGSYNLTICGKDFVEEAIELVPSSQRTFLREGNLKNKKPPPRVVQHKPVPPKTKATPIVTPKLQIQVNRDSSEKNNKDNDKDEYYSDSEENKVPEQGKTAREGFSTQQPSHPYQEGDDERNSSESNDGEGDNDRKEEETMADNDKMTKEEFMLHSEFSPADKQNALRELFNKNVPSKGFTPGKIKQKQDSKVLRINIPSVLDKLFKMALRKSMVKFDSNAKCEPGTTEKINCNVCFCLANGKRLCTDKTC